MSRRRIGQGSFGFDEGGMRRGCSLDDLGSIIDWALSSGLLRIS